MKIFAAQSRSARFLTPAFFLVALGCGAASTPATGPISSNVSATPCEGSAFVLASPSDELATCGLRRSELPATFYGALTFALASVRPNEVRGTDEANHKASPATAKSGAKTAFVLEITNNSEETIPIGFDDSCGAFEATASNEHATTFETECAGICGTQSDGPNSAESSLRERFPRFFLRPHGAVRKTVILDATLRTVRGESCTAENLGPLPPGNYTLEVTLPANWFPTESDDRVERIFRAPIVVTE